MTHLKLNIIFLHIKKYLRRYLRNDKIIHVRISLQIMGASECTSRNYCRTPQWHLVPVIVVVVVVVFCFFCLLFLFLFRFFFGGGGELTNILFILPLLIFGVCLVL